MPARSAITTKPSKSSCREPLETSVRATAQPVALDAGSLWAVAGLPSKRCAARRRTGRTKPPSAVDGASDPWVALRSNAMSWRFDTPRVVTANPAGGGSLFQRQWRMVNAESR
jgi:hypothetical protein